VDFNPIYDTLKLLGYRWTLEILASLAQSPKRFNELQRDVGNYNAKTHGDAVARLVEHGLVRHPNDGDGVHYALTPMGEFVIPALDTFVKGMSQWDDNRSSGDRSRQT
jgi:DNA-binding HxlR family transcriptional regulator